jgi:hypothetical protein
VACRWRCATADPEGSKGAGAPWPHNTGLAEWRRGAQISSRDWSTPSGSSRETSRTNALSVMGPRGVHRKGRQLLPVAPAPTFHCEIRDRFARQSQARGKIKPSASSRAVHGEAGTALRLTICDCSIGSRITSRRGRGATTWCARASTPTAMCSSARII